VWAGCWPEEIGVVPEVLESEQLFDKYINEIISNYYRIRSR